MNWILRGLLLSAAGHVSAVAVAGPQLPVPCAAGVCGTKAPGFVTSGGATATQSGSTLSVLQSTNNATLNWSSFNIGAGGKVVFQQPSATSVALNRIFDANPSSIFGSLTANGQIYLLNANGFLFGANSTVNVAGLLASSLNITDQTFASGITVPATVNNAALQRFTDANNKPILNTGSITVQNGAQLTAADGGRLLLAAPTVQNNGSLIAPDGQIILAAGQTVYLQASADSSLRGLIVQVDGGGTAANQLAGTLSTPRGNVTLAGLIVNQDGRISATTSVSANGSVTLEAADTVAFNNGQPLTASHGGTLELGSSSRIDILPELTDTATAVDAQTQLPSTINLIGQDVFIHGATIDAPSGNLNVTAEANPHAGVQPGDNPQSRLRIDTGTTIDLSGSSAELPMAANLVTVQLRSNELKNDPTQRNGALRGKTVTVDARAAGGLGTSIADVSSAIAAVGKTIAQRTEAGGTATFLSDGDVVFSPGASINVSGGATTYLGGTIQTSALVGANGQLVDIATANPLQAYIGVVNPTLTQTFDKWGVQEVVPTPGLSHFESTYQQGAAAGTVQFAAPSLVLGGNLAATAVNGPYQRGPVGTPDPATHLVPVGDAVPGGSLLIGLGATALANPLTSQFDYVAPPIAVSAHPTPLTVSEDAGVPVQTLELPAVYLTGDGFTNTQLSSNTSFSLPQGLPLQLLPGSSLSVLAPRIDVGSNITALGGKLSFLSALTVADQFDATGVPTLGVGFPRTGIALGDSVTLNVDGQWTNDSVVTGGSGTLPTVQDAGSVKLQLVQAGGELDLGNHVALTADGGAWVKSNGTLNYGKGGAITLDAGSTGSALQFGQATNVEAYGAGTAAGGSFALLTRRLDVSEGAAEWTTAQRVDDSVTSGPSAGQVVNLYAPLFATHGFSSIALTATGAASSPATNDVLTVSSGTTLIAQGQSLQLDPTYKTRGSGGTLGAFTHTATLPGYSRVPTNVSFTASRGSDILSGTFNAYGDLDIQSGASLLADPGATLKLSSFGSILIGGTLRAPGGIVSMLIPSPGTGTTNDPGYVATQGITVESTGIIDVSGGNAVLSPNSQGLLLGTVRPGGSITLNAQRGAVALDAGSMLDFSGTSALLDVANPGPTGGYTRETIATAGGSLTVGSVESVQMLGSLNGNAGTGSGGAAAAGSLEVDLTRNENIAGQPTLFGRPMEIDVVGSTAGSTAPAVANQAILGATQIENSGIDALTLSAGGATPGNILLDTAQPLTLGRQIIFNTRSLTVQDGMSASLSAPFIQIGNLDTQHPAANDAPTPNAGTGVLNAMASQEMVLLGRWALQGTANATLTSTTGDVQLQGVALTSGAEVGSLLTAGNLTINAARIYPDTFTNFSITDIGSAAVGKGTVTLGQTAPSPGTPWSAGGRLNVSADNIVVGGTVVAPFGEINLAANHSLSLLSNSVVSVSGAGLDVPFGQTQLNGAQWVYQSPLGGVAVAGVPSKQVTLTAPNIDLQKNATVDLQGGGDLYAYEWVPGTGGSADKLAGAGVAGNVPGLYAIVPSQAGLAAPFDPQESGSLRPNQTVYLSGGAGVAPGFYALLPARYALAPGALLIQVEPQFSGVTAGQIGALADGTPVVAGYMSAGSTGLHTLSSGTFSGLTEYQGFAIYPGSYAQKIAAYTISNASTYFDSAANQTAAAQAGGHLASPADAGTLTLSVATAVAGANAATTSFNLLGDVRTAAATGGRGALVNVSAPDLEITGANGVSSPGAIAVSGSVLQSWNAGSLTLGGSLASDGNSVQVAANNVTVDAGVQLSADQIFLVAQQAIDLKPSTGALTGASVSSTSAVKGTPLAKLPALADIALTDGTAAAAPLAGAALLAVSDLEVPVVVRGTSPGSAATINLETGSTVSSAGALALDAPGAVSMNGALNGKGASWSLSSAGLAFGAPSSPNAADTLTVNSNVLADLQQAGAVRLASQGAIDIYQGVTLGATGTNSAPSLSALTLLGSAINNQSLDDSVFGGASLTVGNVGAPSANAPSVGTGQLSLVADTLNVGPGTLSVSGFATTLAQVAGAVRSPATTAAGSGSGGLVTAGDLTINAVQINPGVGSTTTLSTTGKLTVGAPTTLAASTTLATSVGGALQLSGISILDAGVIAAPSGVVGMTATGGDLQLAGGASINVAGALLQAAAHSAPSPGGAVNLGASGNVLLDAGTSISVAGEQNAPAGALSINAGGTSTLAGQLLGTAGTGGTGGSFSLDAGQLAGGLDPLAASLTAGGFTNAIAVRTRGGDLALANGGTLTANSITLTADAGAVNIDGVLTATAGARHGVIDLSGGTAVTLGAGGGLHADGAGANGIGGEIDLNSTCATCSITLASGSVISAVGSRQSGELVLRAPALTATNDVAINVGAQGIGADVSHVGSVIIEPVLTTTIAGPGGVVPTDITGDVTTAVTAASNYLTAASSTIAARLAGPAASTSVQAGVELVYSTPDESLVLQSVDLSRYSDPVFYQSGQSPQVVDLSVRAAGSLSIAGAVSDGFVTNANTLAGVPLIDLSTAPSGSLSFVAGADVTSANPLSVIRGSTADLTLKTSATPSDGTADGVGPAVVRTGTGDINLAAGHDVVFEKGTSAYTAGALPASIPGSLELDLNQATLLMSFGAGGGTVRLNAGNDVTGSPVSGDKGNYSVTGWLVRQGQGNPTANGYTPAQYGTNLAGFDWNTGALGGGDVVVSAGRDVNNLSAATSDNLISAAYQIPTVANPNPVATVLGGGGGLAITAGGDIGSAQVYVGNGTGTLIAGGGLTPIRQDAHDSGNTLPLVGSSIALGDSQVDVWARNDVKVNAVYNPTWTPQLLGNDAQVAGQYFIYTGNSAVNLNSTAGNLTFELNPVTSMGTLLGSNVLSEHSSDFLILAPTLGVRALQGDLVTNVPQSPFLLPAATGQLTLFAQGDITSNGGFTLADNLVSTLPTPANPGGALALSVTNSFEGLYAFHDNIHTGDSTPAQITAGRDINNLYLSLPKAADVVAGRDIENLTYFGQNDATSDITLLAAGRDVISPRIQLGGPGSLDILAGRNLNLGFVPAGIRTLGNLLNPNLPTSQGADINAFVGYGSQGADLGGFLQKVIAPSSAYQGQLISYVEGVTATSNLNFAQAEAAFATLDSRQQSALVDNVFFNELLLSGRAANSGTGVGFTQGYAAIDALYPKSRTGTTSPYTGDLTMSFSQIYTLSGGNISLLVPGGQIGVGLANPPASLAANTPASQLGIVAEGPGNISIYSLGDVNVDQSRIFTLGGGNVLIWSTTGSIDAGNGSKSSLSIPPPRVLISSNGTVSFDFGGALASGSGIRTIQTNPSVPPGNVDLDAPVGTVNAGDAGIGASGNINIAAARVIGIDNINFGGSAAGVPSEVSGLGVSLAGVSSVASSATSSAESSAGSQSNAKDTAPLAATALSWLDVFVTGLGEENCKPNDVECLNRQKKASP